MSLSLHDFQYHLPEKLIAQSPADPRDSARLLLLNRQTHSISHHLVSDLPLLLPPNYDLVVNNTKVFPARLLGHKTTGGAVEILLLHKLSSARYRVITRPGLKVNQTIILSPTLSARVTHVADRLRTLNFSQTDPTLTESLAQLGSMPTPPYIKRLLKDPADYQTVYAKYGFSAAAPTAGLHFTPHLIHTIKQAHAWHELTLNVGLGTFLPVKAEKITDHLMHAESYTLSPSTSLALTHLVHSSRRLLAVGTTTVRALESNLANHPSFTPGIFSTSIFMYPPYHFRATDALLTNFHLPGSTLLMLVSAFVSAPNTNEPFTTFSSSLLGQAYAEAVRERYRFFSFGDAMLIL